MKPVKVFTSMGVSTTYIEVEEICGKNNNSGLSNGSYNLNV